VIDEPLEEDDRLRIIERTPRIIRLHMSLVERLIHDRLELMRCHEVEYSFGRVHDWMIICSRFFGGVFVLLYCFL
jgi:hypothetical protein